VALLATVGSVVVALTYVIGTLPDLFEKSQDAYVALDGLFEASPAAGFAQELPPRPANSSDSARPSVPVAELGPKPGPNCHQV